MPKYITLKHLTDNDACSSQARLFKRLFGDRVEVTLETMDKYGSKFDVGWAVQNLLDKPAYDEYDKVQQPAYDEYDKVKQSAYDKYKKVKQSAYDEYWKVKQSAWDKYKKVKQSAFVQAYISME